MVNADLDRLDFPNIWTREPETPKGKFLVILIALILGAIVIFSVKTARAEVVDIERLADAIYYAEGGAKTSHPYGILAHYKTTTPRQACINTIKHAQRDFGGGDFISFLAERYAPTKNCFNDPTGLNKNWERNVKNIYAKLQKGSV